VYDYDARDSLLNRMSEMGNDGRGVVFLTVHDVINACATQKSGKAVGLHLRQLSLFSV